MNRFFYFLLLGCFVLVSKAQNMDSLKLALKSAKHDTVRCELLLQMIENENDDLVWPKYNEELQVICEKNLKNLPVNHPQYNYYTKCLAAFYSNKGYMAGNLGEPAKGMIYNQKSIDLLQQLLKNTSSPALQKEIKKDLANSINNLGSSYKQKGDLVKTAEYMEQSLKIQSEINDKEGEARSLSNLAYVYNEQGNIPKAIDYNHRSLKIRELINDKEGISYSLNNLGTMHLAQNNYDKSLEYFNKAYKIQVEINDRSLIAQSLNNIGYLNQIIGKHNLALKNYEESLKQREALKDKQGIGECLINLAGLFKLLAGLPENKNNKKIQDSLNERAVNNYNRALEIQLAAEDIRGAAISMINLSEVLCENGDYKRAKDFGEKGLKISQEIGNPGNIKYASATLSRVYRSMGNFEDAYEMLVLNKMMSDSVNNENTKKASLQKSFQYEYDKKAAADSIRVYEERKVTAAQLKQERTQRFALYGGLALVITFSIFVFNRFRITQKQKTIIEKQKSIVDEKNLELNKQNIEIDHQKQLIEEHQKEMIDSITYAKRIQDAILPPTDLIKEKLPVSFVLYKPKDIVAGDFYWMEQIGDTILIAAADCTGHGVPGAMVSVVCSNALNRAVKEFYLSDTGAILDKVTDLVLETFEKSVAEVKDGMDISLLSINKVTKEIKWSGANNPLWYASSLPSQQTGVSAHQSSDENFEEKALVTELVEVTADKQPIGKSDHRKPFKTHIINYKEGTTFYLFTDGYADQFGGPKGKKYKYKQFHETLITCINKEPVEQQLVLSKSFESWKGELEQVDDVCIIGIRL